MALFKLYATEYHPEEIVPNAPKPVAPPCDVNAKNISDLITQDSELNIEELEQYCLQGQYYKALALIYRHTHRYRKALEVWSKYATCLIWSCVTDKLILDSPRTSTSIRPPTDSAPQPRTAFMKRVNCCRR